MRLNDLLFLTDYSAGCPILPFQPFLAASAELILSASTSTLAVTADVCPVI
jgi:hypothetical protein